MSYIGAGEIKAAPIRYGMGVSKASIGAAADAARAAQEAARIAQQGASTSGLSPMLLVGGGLALVTAVLLLKRKK